MNFEIWGTKVLCSDMFFSLFDDMWPLELGNLVSLLTGQSRTELVTRDPFVSRD